MRSQFFFAFMLFLIGPVTQAQAVLVVDQNGGPGSAFTRIQDAVDAAESGDTVLVRPGTYFEAVTIRGTKSLNVEAGPEGQVNVAGIHVFDVGAGATVKFRSIQPTQSLAFSPQVIL